MPPGAVSSGDGFEYGVGLMVNRSEALTICETVLSHAKAAGAEDATVTLQSSVESHARFADNRITTSGRSEDLELTVTVWVGQRRGAATGNDPGADALKRMADEAVLIARVSPIHREYVPTLGPLEYAESKGFAEATANFAKLVSGRLSDRSMKRKPWIMAGYGLAALSKPLFPIANGAAELIGARFADRVGKGIRGSPRDAMVADETPPEIRLRPPKLGEHNEETLRTLGYDGARIESLRAKKII